MLIGANFHSRFPKRSNFSPPRPTCRCSFKEPFEGLGHSAVFTNDSPASESTVKAPYRHHFPSAPVTLSSMDNVTVQLHFVRLAFCWRCRNGGLQQAHVDRKCPTSETPGKQGNPPEHNLPAGDFSRLASFRSWLCRRFLSADRTPLKIKGCYRRIPSSTCLSSGFLHPISRGDHHGNGR